LSFSGLIAIEGVAGQFWPHRERQVILAVRVKVLAAGLYAVALVKTDQRCP
jgi:hypothetical protein